MFLPCLSIFAPPVTGASAYPNGYGYGRAQRIAGDVLGGSAIYAGVPLWYDESLPEYRTVANGGFVQHGSGYDIRFEAAGLKLAHELEVYDPVGGRVAAWIGLPDLPPGQDFDLFAYIGKAGLVASEANPAGAWSGCYGSWRMPDGIDMSGQGRDLTMSGVSSTTILGMPAAVFGAASYGELADPSFFDRISEWTLAWWADVSSLPNNATWLRIGSSASGTARHAIWWEPAPGQSPTTTNTLAGGYKLSDGSQPQLFGGTGSATTGLQHLAYAAKVGQSPIWTKNGQKLVSTLIGGAGAGVTGVQSGEPLRFGAGFGVNPEAVRGKRGRLIMFKQAKTPEFLRFLYQNQADPRSVYGLSDIDQAGDRNRAPLVAPLSISCPAGDSVIVPILDHASDPDGAALSPVASTSPAQGTAEVSDDGLVYTASAGAAGTDSFLAGATDGLKQALARVSVTITAGGGGGGPDPGGDGYTDEPEIPAGLTLVTVGYTLPGITRYDTLAAAFAAIPAGGGYEIRLNPSANSYGTVPLARSFDETVLINTAGAPGSVKGIFRPTGNNIWVRGIDLGNLGNAKLSPGDGVRIYRCFLSGFRSGTDAYLFVNQGYVSVCYNSVDGSGGAAFEWSPKDGGLDGICGRNLIRNIGNDFGLGNGHEVIRNGRNPKDRVINSRNLFAENRVYNCNRDSSTGSGAERETFGMKCSGATIRGNTLDHAASFSNRHSGLGNRYLSNWCENAIYYAAFDLRDKGALFAGNVTPDGQISIRAGDCTTELYVDGHFPSCLDWHLVGNRGKLVIGDQTGDPVKFDKPARNTRVEAHNGQIVRTMNSGGEAGTSIQSQAGTSFTPARKLSDSDVGPNSPWLGWPTL